MKLLAPALMLALSLDSGLLAKQEGKVELRWKWQKGQELIFKSSQKTLLEFGGQTLWQSATIFSAAAVLLHTM